MKTLLFLLISSISAYSQLNLDSYVFQSNNYSNHLKKWANGNTKVSFKQKEHEIYIRSDFYENGSIKSETEVKIIAFRDTNYIPDLITGEVTPVPSTNYKDIPNGDYKLYDESGKLIDKGTIRSKE